MHQYLLSALECAVPRRSAFYISIPITTGLNFLTWYKATGKSLDKKSYSSAHYKEVVVTNVEKASKNILLLRDRHPGKIIIEPTSLEVPDWTQEQYLDFWGDVIKKFINRVYLSPGWSYSRGCAFEFLTAVENGIELFDINEEPISVFEGSNLIKKAVSEYTSLDLDSEFLSNIAARLDSISSAHEKPPLQR